MVCSSVKGGGTKSSGRYAFPGGVPEVIPPPCLLFPKHHSADSFFFLFKGAALISAPDVRNHIIGICLKF